MANDAALRACLLWLAVVILAVGICTHSFKKMLTTYVLGLVGISCLLLPDWDYFNRDISRWPYPVTVEERTEAAFLYGSGFSRFTKSPLRVITYSLIYGYAICKWWEYVSG
ncbi:signal peptidase complex-like protein DTM1 [Vicia villosa]|uniref:signal peptidase complex-like protein DTM1 n=1 Tax=Vicia villosa TaxID=3911 RepID=UPI00273C897D|nr:signal peptidase complex-like protein DTM1 [Vicia villosa]